MVVYIADFILSCSNQKSAARFVRLLIISMDIYGLKPEADQLDALLHYGWVRRYHILHVEADEVYPSVQEEMVNSIEDTLTPEIVNGDDKI